MEKTLSQLLDKRIKLQLILYFVIFLGFIGVVIYHIARHDVGFLLPIIGLALGIGIGIFATRVFHISWDHGAQKVIARLDTVGIIIFILCIVLEFFQEKYLAYFIQGPLVLAISFAVFAGVMLGRLIGIRRKVREVLKEQDIVD